MREPLVALLDQLAEWGRIYKSGDAIGNITVDDEMRKG
jgi:hypothetical protein